MSPEPASAKRKIITAIIRLNKFLGDYFWYWFIPLFIVQYFVFFQRYPEHIWIVNYMLLAAGIFLVLFTIIFCPVLVLVVLIFIVGLIKGEVKWNDLEESD